MENYATFDRSTFPLIVVKFTGTKADDENFAVYLEGLRANYDAEKPFALIFDASDAASPSIKYQQRQAQWMKEHQTLIQTYCLGIAYVVPNVLLRGILKMIFSIQKSSVPFKVFGSMEQGLAWAEECTAHLSGVEEEK